jgi:uncharacterized membrane protein YdjX (TVP38/TMEM64 family)
MPTQQGDSIEPRTAAWPRLVLLAIILGALGSYFALDVGTYLDFETFLAHRQRLLDYTRDHYWAVLGAAAALYAAMTALSIPGGSLRSLAVGFLFGHWAGSVIIVFAATAGATLAFLSARYLFAQAVQRRLGARGAKLMRGFAINAFQYLLFLRLVPLFPFWLVNLAPGLTPIRLRVFVGATAVGIAPASFIVASVGHMFALGEPIRDLAALEAALLTHPLAIVAALVGVAMLGWALLTKHRFAKETEAP